AEMILDEIDADLFARAPQMLRQKQGKRVVALAHDVDVVGQVVRTAYAANGHGFQLGSVLRKVGAEWQVAAPRAGLPERVVRRNENTKASGAHHVTSLLTTTERAATSRQASGGVAEGSEIVVGVRAIASSITV